MCSQSFTICLSWPWENILWLEVLLGHQWNTRDRRLHTDISIIGGRRSFAIFVVFRNKGTTQRCRIERTLGRFSRMPYRTRTMGPARRYKWSISYWGAAVFNPSPDPDLIGVEGKPKMARILLWKEHLGIQLAERVLSYIRYIQAIRGVLENPHHA